MMFFSLYVSTPPPPPPLNHIMSEYYINLEYHIEEATDAIHDGEYKFASTAAQAFGVPVRTLQRRLAGTHTSLFEHTWICSEYRAKGGYMYIYLTRLDKLSIPARLRHLRRAASKFRESSPSWTALASTISTAKSLVFQERTNFSCR